MAATDVGVVWLDTPRGVLGKCFKCGALSMRKCECYQDKKKNEANSRGLNAFHGGRDGMAPSPDKTPTSPDKENVGEDDLKRPDSNLGMGHFVRPNSVMGGGSSRGGSSLWFNYEGKTAEDLLIDLKKWREEGLIDEDEYKGQKAAVLSATAESFRASSTTPYPASTSTYSRSFGDPRMGKDRPVSSLSMVSDLDHGPDEPGAAPGVKRARIDFYFKQLRQICYRKVRGNGNDVSIREIFRHFDTEKHGESPGIDQDEFVLAVKRLMLGSADHGIITTDEAIALFARIDADGSGTIDYRETADTLSLPGWDNKLLGKKSNVLL